MKSKLKTTIIFGGNGFIGSFFAEELLRTGASDKVILADIESIGDHRFLNILQPYLDSGVLEWACCDVRKSIERQLGYLENISLIANFAAIHREPGHQPHEYYETNLPGAENVCTWATKVGCQDIIFTSSIAPYGPSETPKTEQDIPAPISAYGGSKLAAEKIHLIWQSGSHGRNLTIVRPGVVFGPGEGGNVSRLIKATLKGYFFYMGNKNTRKAGTYVRELTHAMLWVHQRGREINNGKSLFNMTMTPAPSINEYIDTILKVSDRRKWIPNVPFLLLYPISFILDGLARLIGIKQPINPIRLRKLIKSNHIVPAFLVNNDYKYKYTLETAFKEWKKTSPEEWFLKK